MSKLLLPFLMLFLIFPGKMYGQKSPSKSKGFDYTKKRFGIFISPASFFEIKNATTGIGMSYRLSRKWEIAAEPGYVYDVWDKTLKSKGARIILTAKRFFSKGRLFFGLDVRAKAYSFNDEQDFVNVSANDSLYKYKHRVRTTFIGIAPIFGIRAPISKNKRFVFQFNAGVGAKYRDVDRKNIPAGFTLHEKFYRATEWISPEYYGGEAYGSRISGFTIYFPLTIRYVYYF
ncbi:MAG: hypothetical protein ABI402_17175 [Ferruginibacter sp.]